MAARGGAVHCAPRMCVLHAQEQEEGEEEERGREGQGEGEGEREGEREGEGERKKLRVFGYKGGGLRCAIVQNRTERDFLLYSLVVSLGVCYKSWDDECSAVEYDQYGKRVLAKCQYEYEHKQK